MSDGAVSFERKRQLQVCRQPPAEAARATTKAPAEAAPIDSCYTPEPNLFDGQLGVDPQDLFDARIALEHQLQRETRAVAAVMHGDLDAIDSALSELDAAEADAEQTLARSDATKAERVLAERTVAGLIPKEKGTVSLADQRAALEARRTELSAKADPAAAARAQQKAAGELMAIDVLMREFGITPKGSPLETLAKAAGLKKLDEASIKGWNRIAAGEYDHPDVERAPLTNALSRIAIERESFNAEDTHALGQLAAKGVKTRDELLAISSNINNPIETRGAARKVLQHPELAKALMPNGVLDRKAISAFEQRRQSLSQVGTDGRVLLDRFEARAANDARALSSALRSGDTTAALKIIADRDQLGRAWLLEEYAAIHGEGAISRDLQKLDPRAQSAIASALTLDVSARTATIQGIVAEPPAGTTRAAFQGGVLEKELATTELHRAALAKSGNLAQRAANIQAIPAELAYLDATIARAKQALATNDPQAIERVAAAVVAAEAMTEGRMQRTNDAIATVQAFVDFTRALAITAGAAAVTIQTLGGAAPTVGGVVCTSWLKVAAAVAVGTGAGTVAGTTIALSDEAVRAFALGRGWKWSNVGRDAQQAVMLSLSTAVSAGGGAGLIGRAAASANPAVRAMMNNGWIRTVLVAGARGGAAVAGEGAAQTVQGELNAKALAENGAKTFLGAAVLGPFGTNRSGVAHRLYDATLGAAEEAMWNAVTGRPLSTNLAQAMVGSALSGALHAQAAGDVKAVRVADLRAEAEARAARRAHGGVHGENVYSQKNVDPKDATKGRLGPSRLEQHVKKVVGKPRMHGAQLAAINGNEYSLSLKARDGSTLKATVFITAEPHAKLEEYPRHVNTDGVEEAGPAHVSFERSQNEVTIRIRVGNKVDHHDLENIVGHELDEVSDILYRRPGATESEISAEMQASVFRRDAVSGTAKPTAHDRAQAIEYLTAVGQLPEYQREVKRLDGKSNATQQDRDALTAAKRGAAEREKNIEEMEKVMGLDRPENAAEKLTLLRSASLERGAVSRAPAHQQIAWREHIDAHAIEYAKMRYPEAFTGEMMTKERVAHVILPEPHSALGGKGDFIGTGIKGGHQDEELKRFVANHPELGYRLEQDGPEQVINGVTYRKYKQYLKTPGGEVQSKHPKTTTTDATKLIKEGQAIFSEWLKAGGYVDPVEGASWSGRTPEGIEISGYVHIVDAQPTITAIFVEAKWIQ